MKQLEEAIENTKKRINAWKNIADIGKATLSKEEYENSQNICEEQKLLIEAIEHLQKENAELKTKNRTQKKLTEFVREATAEQVVSTIEEFVCEVHLQCLVQATTRKKKEKLMIIMQQTLWL